MVSWVCVRAGQENLKTGLLQWGSRNDDYTCFSICCGCSLESPHQSEE